MVDSEKLRIRVPQPLTNKAVRQEMGWKPPAQMSLYSPPLLCFLKTPRDSLCSPGYLGTFRDPPASASECWGSVGQCGAVGVSTVDLYLSERKAEKLVRE